MKNRFNIVKFALFITIIILLAITVGWLSGRISEDFYFGVLSAGVITSVNFVAGIFSIRIGINKSPKGFITAFLGGMVLRLFLLLALVFICLQILDLSGNNFIFSILFFYVFYLISEIFYLNLNNNL